jgi:hypothetical protein
VTVDHFSPSRIQSLQKLKKDGMWVEPPKWFEHFWFYKATKVVLVPYNPTRTQGFRDLQWPRVNQATICKFLFFLLFTSHLLYLFSYLFVHLLFTVFCINFFIGHLFIFVLNYLLFYSQYSLSFFIMFTDFASLANMFLSSMKKSLTFILKKHTNNVKKNAKKEDDKRLINTFKRRIYISSSPSSLLRRCSIL